MKNQSRFEQLGDLYRRKGMATHQHCELKSMVKDVDTKNGIITGYFSAFDNVDSGARSGSGGPAVPSALRFFASIGRIFSSAAPQC